MKGYKLIQLNTLADLEKSQCEFWVTDYGYDFDDIKHSFTDLGGMPTEFEPVEAIVINYATSVHDRVFVEPAKAWKAKDGNVYMDNEEFGKHG